MKICNVICVQVFEYKKKFLELQRKDHVIEKNISQFRSFEISILNNLKNIFGIFVG